MRRNKGFTLTELLMVVAIIGIMAAIAVPSYRSHVATVNRSAAQQLLLQAAQRQQQYFLDARAYTAAPNSTGLNLTPPNEHGWTCSATQCANANFILTIVVTAGPPPTFTATATPTTTGTSKSEAAMTINNAGAKTGKWSS